MNSEPSDEVSVMFLAVLRELDRSYWQELDFWRILADSSVLFICKWTQRSEGTSWKSSALLVAVFYMTCIVLVLETRGLEL